MVEQRYSATTTTPPTQDDSIPDENWATCKVCGSKVLIDPQTEQPEVCAECLSRQSKMPLSIGMGLLTFGAVLIVGLVIYGISILL